MGKVRAFSDPLDETHSTDLLCRQIMFQRTLRKIRDEEPRLKALAMYWCGDKDVADRLVAEVFIDAWHRVGRLQEIAAIRAWLTGMLRRRYRLRDEDEPVAGSGSVIHIDMGKSPRRPRYNPSGTAVE